MSYLHGVRVKINRAKKHLADLNLAIAAFKARGPHSFSIEIEPETGYEVYRFREREAIPSEWGAIIGDCVHNLRSALDLMANELVIANGGTPTQYTVFPIASSRERFYARTIQAIDGVSDRAKWLIERLNPYEGGGGPLWRLHAIDIRDKHRLLIPVAARHEMFFLRSHMLGPGYDHLPRAPRLGGTPIDRKFPLKEGDKLLIYNRPVPSSDFEDKTEFDFAFEIAFGEGQIFDGDPVLPTLHQLVDFTESVIDVFAREIFCEAW